MELGDYTPAAKIWALTGMSGVSVRAFSRLAQKFGSLDAIFSAGEEELREAFEISDESLSALAEASSKLAEAADFIDSLQYRRIQHITMYDEDYPESLRESHTPPPIVFYQGTLPSKDEKTVTFVGSSAPSAEGIEVAVDFAEKMSAEGVSLVTGLARGIDAAALVALTGEKSQSKVYAIASSGLADIYPEEHLTLAAQCAEHGAIISERHPDAPPTSAGIFEANRLLVSLGRAVVIGEVLTESMGTLDVVDACAEAGKIVFVLIPSEKQALDKDALERVVERGAIPVRYPEDFGDIVKCLV